ncbi:antitoxin HipB [Rhodobiaceae bacterium]|nr:antitoxin HipB [Rhodobiaceae bacterium]
MSYEKAMSEAIARSPEQLGQVLRNRRRNLELTQTDLAKKIGSYQKTISKIEAGQPGVKLQTIFDVIAALDIEIVIQTRSQSSARIEDIF